MGKFKNEGVPTFTLMEELSEAIQVIAKRHRFDTETAWDDIPEGKEISRWEELCNEMEDVLYQWNRVVIDYHHNMSEGIESKPLSVKNWSLLAYMNKDQESSYSK